MKTETSFLGKLYKKVLSTVLSVLLVFGTFGSTVAFAIDGGSITNPTVTIEADGNIDTPVNLESDGTVTCGVWYTAAPDTSFKISSEGEGYYVVESYNCGDPKISFGNFSADNCGSVTYHDNYDFFAYMYLTEYDLEYETGVVSTYSDQNIVFRVLYMADVCPENTDATDSGYAYDISKIQNIELSVVRDIYANFEDVSNAFQALITFENGTEFVYDMCYAYDSDISYENWEIYTYLVDWFVNDWSFECADSTATPGTVSVKVTCTQDFEYSGEFNVNVVESPVDRIEVRNNLIHYDYETENIWNLDKEGYSIDNLDLVIHYKDGTQIDVKEWYQNHDYACCSYDGESMFYEFGEAPEYGYKTYCNHRHSIYFKANQADTDWTAGNSYPVTVEYLGVSATYYVEIIENPVESIEFIPAKPIELVYEVDGYNETVYNYETGEESRFFYYDYSIASNGNVLRVNYTDGSSVDYTFSSENWGFFDENGNILESYSVRDTQYSEHWSSLGDYSVELSCMNRTCSIPVSVVENPVESIEFIPAKPIELIYEVDGCKDGYYDSDRDSYVEFFRYEYKVNQVGNIFRVNYNDGTTVDYVFDSEQWEFVDENGNTISSPRNNDTQSDNPWSTTGTYYFNVYYMGKSCQVPVTVIENPVASIEFVPAKPIELVFGVDGYISERYDEQSDSWVEFFRYSYNIRQEGNIFRVNYSDGRTVDYTYYIDCWNFCDKDGNVLENFSVNDNQSSYPWDSVGEYSIEIDYMGRVCNVPVTVVENPVESIEFVSAEPIEVMYETDGYWSNRYNNETYVHEYYFRYGYSLYKDGNIITVNFTDGRSVDYVFDSYNWGFFDSDGNELVDFSIDDTQYENHWANVGTYSATVSYMGRECQVPVKVTESPVASINFIPAEPFKAAYEYDGYVESRYNADTDEFEDYFRYSYFDCSKGDVLEVTYKDGSVTRFVSEDGSFDFGDGFVVSCFDTQQTSPWRETGTYYATVKYMGVSCQIPVVIYDSAYPHLKYSVVDGKAYITGVKNNFDGDNLEIPNELDGYTVVGLSDYVVPWDIKNISLPASLVSISSKAFYGCDNLESITVESGNTAYESYNGVLYTKGKTEIVKIPEKFSGELYIPATFKEQDFEGTDLSGATSVVFDKNNPYIVYENGVLYNIDKTKVITATSEVSTNYTMPATVKEIHSSAFVNNSVLQSVKISSSVVSISYSTFAGCSALKSVELPRNLEKIEYNAFSGCTSLQNITMPASLRSIGYQAFGNTTSLKSVSLNNGLQTVDFSAFSHSGLESVVIPGSVEIIQSSTFYCCENLTSVTIGNGVNAIEYDAFEDCTKLSSVSIPDSVTSINSTAFDNTAYVNTESNWVNGVLYINNHLIRASETLSGNYSIKQGTVNIADDAFFDCNNVTAVTIPNGLRNIGNYAFGNCGKITSFTAPESVETVGHGAFSSCSKLQSVEIGNPDAVLGSGAFANCGSLSQISLANGLKEIPYACFSRSAITSLKLPDTVTDIGYMAFSGSEKLAEIDLPANLQHLGGRTFDGTKWYADQPNGVIYIDNFLYGCKANCPDKLSIKAGTRGIASYALENSSVSEVTIPDSVEYINEYAFYTCTNLKSVEIPGNIKEIGEYAFGYYEKDGSNPLKVTDFVIKGYVGSVAEQYAKDNGFEFVPLQCSHINTTVVNAKKATCTESGYTGDKVCTDCGTVVKEGSKINALGHKSSDWIIDKNATASAAGSKHKECTVCKAVLEKATIPQLKCAAPKLAKVESTGSGVKVTWSKTAGADSYIVYRKTYSSGKWSGWSAIKSGISSSATTYTDTTAKSGVYYIYTVRAKNEAGLGSFDSTGLKIKFLATPKLSSVANGSGKVTVKWGKVTGASSYTVYRKTYSNGKWSSWTKIGTTKNTYYNDTKVSSGKYYKYTVRATSGDYSSYYNTSGLQIKYLAVVSLKSATSQKAGVKVTWSAVSGAKGYEVYRRTYSKGKWSGWTKIKTISSGSTVSYTDKTAKKGVTYKYTVRATSDSYKGYYNTSGLQVKDKY